MKILILHHRYRSYGGEDQVVDSSKKALEALGHQVEVFSTHSPQKGLSGKIKLALITLFPWLYSTKTFLQKVDLFQPDVIHAHNLFPFWFQILPKMTRVLAVPVILTLHNFRFLCLNGLFFRKYSEGKYSDCQDCLTARSYFPGVKNNCRENLFESILYYLALRRFDYAGFCNSTIVDRIVCPSAFLREQYVKAGVKPEKLVILRNGADLSWLENTQSAETYESERTSSRHVLYLGRISHEKGVEMIPPLAKQLPQFTFHVIGDGPLLAELKSQQSENMLFYGHLPKTSTELLQAWQKCEIVLIPSICFENYPLLPLEAKVSRKLIVAADRPGIRESTGSYSDVLYFEPGDTEQAQKALLSIKRKSTQSASYSIASMNDHAKNLLRLYQSKDEYNAECVSPAPTDTA